MFFQRNTPSPATGYAPSELFIGRRLKSQLDLLRPNKSVNQNSKTPNMSSKVSKKSDSNERKFAKYDEVVVRNFSRVNTEKWVPGIVVRSVGSQCYEVDVGNRTVKIHIDHMLRNHTDSRRNHVTDNDEMYTYLSSDDETDDMDNLDESLGLDNGADDVIQNENELNESYAAPIPARDRYPVVRGNRTPDADTSPIPDRRYPVRIRRPVHRYGFSPHFYKQ